MGKTCIKRKRGGMFVGGTPASWAPGPKKDAAMKRYRELQLAHPNLWQRKAFGMGKLHARDVLGKLKQAFKRALVH